MDAGTDRIRPDLLNRLEFEILESIRIGMDSLYALCKDSQRNLNDVAVKDVAVAIVALLERNFIEPHYFSFRRDEFVACSGGLDADSLIEHLRYIPRVDYLGQAPEELGGDFFFDVTEQGLAEEERAEYDAYKPEGDIG
ncbi:MAG: hypothetical protein FJ319_13100 [SAR202 cluster bacterium]|nr:hypothetical protein [SAR202 cluster bacterium]